MTGSAWRIAAIPTLFKAHPTQKQVQTAVAIQLSPHKKQPALRCSKVQAAFDGCGRRYFGRMACCTGRDSW
ncbi:hypothetical protein HMPREF9098_1695 [Kingella denitrificans ATCC 33394]|uniref:Uncharacterized protein n=1 Tax=Kingella denitrificans ATCC 33394 TaxID=888741 RepID=F0F0R0_9NEIS|nr:hypothetical protein HMPREF9098_1695 [Kingella denitrificans ATCC 33394]